MPMTWDAAAKAKLLSTLLEVCDIHPNGAQLKQIADAFGSECTPKALMHQLAKFRNEGKATSGTATPKAANKITKRTSTLKRGGKKAEAEMTRTPSPDAVEGDAEDGAEGSVTPPPTTTSTKRKRARLMHGPKAVEVEGLEDRVQIAVGEDIGEGLRRWFSDADSAP